MVRKKLAIFMVLVMIFSLFSTSGLAANTSFSDNEDEMLHLKFDLGTDSSPVAEGYTKVSQSTLYSSDRGYGFENVADSRDQGGPTDLLRDFVIASGNTFMVDLPVGEYEIEIVTGSQNDVNRTNYTLQGGDIKGGDRTGGGEFITYEDTFTVFDGQLEASFSNEWARINAIEIVQISGEAPEPTEPEESPFLLFDFGNGPTAEGYLQVSNNLIYNEDRGYGINKSVAERDRGAPDDIRRDFLIDGNFEFMVDLPDGEYFIRIIAGDNIAFNRSSFVVEGEHLGSFTSNSGQFAEVTHTTTVSDGQLNIQMGDNGRINGLEIMPVAQIDSLEVSELSFSPETYVGLSWEPHDSAESYNVHRKEEGQGNFTRIGNTSETNFIDNTVELGNTYTYVVTFLTDLGVESAFSNEVEVSVSDDSVPAPFSPSELSIDELVVEEEVTFSWNENDDALLYYVYRTRYNPEHFPNGEVFERVGVTNEATFTDQDIFSPNPYYYVVRAVNEGGISNDSEVLAVQPREKSETFYGKGPFHAQVLQTGDKWRVINRGVVYVGDDMLDAMQAAVDSLTPGRTKQEKVIVRGSGTIPANRSLELPSHTSFEIDGTIHVEGIDEDFDYGNHNAAVRIRHAENVSIPKLNVTGSPNFGIFVRTSEDIHLGQIDLRLDAGLGIRIDSRDNDNVYGVRNVRIDDVYVSGTSAHGVETYGVDGITIGTVTAVDTGYSGVLLNDTINAEVGIVYGYGAGTGTGYAAFRMANRNGHIDDDYTHNIFVGEVVARGGGRGIFSVSRSGGAVIDRVDLARTGGNAMLIENSYNIAMNGGVVVGPSGIRIAARNDMPNTRDILMQNLTLRNSEIVESPCGDNMEFRNITLENSTMNVCGQ
ncbi:fibronectin type III domain-containing protein [Evansella sp. AB-rgal1]|uniref:fibronectin type III domain-containing protein n=1 Tax=Evansella sp. AB-rgal1 TaxID=3242696 RepID=UPI00359E0DD0